MQRNHATVYVYRELGNGNGNPNYIDVTVSVNSHIFSGSTKQKPFWYIDLVRDISEIVLENRGEKSISVKNGKSLDLNTKRILFASPVPQDEIALFKSSLYEALKNRSGTY